MNVPSNLKYSNDHEWCRMEGDTAYVGITDFAQSQLGDIVFVDVPTEGETVAAGEVFGTIEAVKTVSDAFLPVSGEIVEFNAAVDADPSIVNKDPYGEGWLVKVRVSDPAEYDTLLTAETGTAAPLGAAVPIYDTNEFLQSARHPEEEIREDSDARADCRPSGICSCIIVCRPAAGGECFDRLWRNDAALRMERLRAAALRPQSKSESFTIVSFSRIGV